MYTTSTDQARVRSTRASRGARRARSRAQCGLYMYAMRLTERSFFDACNRTFFRHESHPDRTPRATLDEGRRIESRALPGCEGKRQRSAPGPTPGCETILEALAKKPKDLFVIGSLRSTGGCSWLARENRHQARCLEEGWLHGALHLRDSGQPRPRLRDSGQPRPRLRDSGKRPRLHSGNRPCLRDSGNRAPLPRQRPPPPQQQQQ